MGERTFSWFFLQNEVSYVMMKKNKTCKLQQAEL